MALKLVLLSTIFGFALRASAVAFYLSAITNSGGQQVFPVSPTAPKGLSTLANTIEIPSFNFDVETPLSLGAQGSGAGAGKITFNPLTLNRKIDQYSPLFFKNCASGVPFKTFTLTGVKLAGSANAQQIFVTYVFNLVAVKSIAWAAAAGDDAPSENISFEYGSLEIDYTPTKVDGTPGITAFSGWNRITNTGCFGTTPGSACA